MQRPPLEVYGPGPSGRQSFADWRPSDSRPGGSLRLGWLQCRCAGSTTVVRISPHTNSPREAFGKPTSGYTLHLLSSKSVAHEFHPSISELSFSPLGFIAERADVGCSIIKHEEQRGGLLRHRWIPTVSLAFISKHARESLYRCIELGQPCPLRRQPDQRRKF